MKKVINLLNSTLIYLIQPYIALQNWHLQQKAQL